MFQKTNLLFAHFCFLRVRWRCFSRHGARYELPLRNPRSEPKLRNLTSQGSFFATHQAAALARLSKRSNDRWHEVVIAFISPLRSRVLLPLDNRLVAVAQKPSPLAVAAVESSCVRVMEPRHALDQIRSRSYEEEAMKASTMSVISNPCFLKRT